MTSPILTALIYAVIPSIVAVVGTVGATFWQPNEAVRSALLHFAAGVAFAVVAVELLPRVMRGTEALPWVLAGFGAGILIMLGLRWLENRMEPAEGSEAGKRSWPLGLIGSGAIDQVLDGILLGIGITAGEALGALLSLSMTVEDLTFALAIASGFGATRGMRWQKIGTAAGLGALLVAASVVASIALGGLNRNAVKLLLALSAAALLYVVTEQLLVEAHEKMRSSLLATTFFVGFLFIMVLGMFTGA